MANFTASIVNRAIAAPVLKSRTEQNQGRIRMWESLYQAPASGTAPAIADKIIWGQMPIGAFMLTHLARLDFNTGTASCTINLGDSCVAAKHLAATAINATGSATPSVASFIKTATMTTLSGSFQLTNVLGIGVATVGDLITGTGIPAASYVTAVDVANRVVTFSNLAGTAATASASVTVTCTGHPYRAMDNSANADNSYVSTTDDATLISVVAGAQVANNQMIRLIMPYVMD